MRSLGSSLEQLYEVVVDIFLRCAVHFGVAQPQDLTLYNRLLATNVYRSSGITNNLTVSTDGSVVTVADARDNLHIEDDKAQLRLYVPNDDHERELCYLSQMPMRLVSYLAISDPAAIKIVSDIIKTKLSLLGHLLDAYGIVPVPGIEYVLPLVNENPLVCTSADGQDLGVYHLAIDQSSPSSSSSYSSSNRSRRESIASSFTRYSSPSITSHRNSPSRKEQQSPTRNPCTRSTGSPRLRLLPEPSRHKPRHTLEQDFVTDLQTAWSTPSPKPLRRRGQRVLEQAALGDRWTHQSSLSFEHPGVDEQPPLVETRSDINYVNLLHGVIRAAARAELPFFSPTAIATVPSDLSTLVDMCLGNGALDQISHDTRLGAAGELFVCQV